GVENVLAISAQSQKEYSAPPAPSKRLPGRYVRRTSERNRRSGPAEKPRRASPSPGPGIAGYDRILNWTNHELTPYFFSRFITPSIGPAPAVDLTSVGRFLPCGSKQALSVSPSSS